MQNTHHLDADTTTPETRRKRKLLTVLKVKIKLLKDQLEATENELRSLEAELLTNDSSARSSGIDHLPEELLVDIFQLTLMGNHPHIRNLLLVSRRWNSIVMNTPSLWTTIQLILRGRGTSLYDTIDAAEAYHNACIQRSGGMLLDVSIEASTVHLIVAQGDREASRDYLYHRRLCQILIGGGGARSQSETIRDPRNGETNLIRWKTFYLELPKMWQELDLLSAVFQLHAPNLTTIEIFEADSDDCFLPHFEDFVGRTAVHSYVANTESLTRFGKLRFAYLKLLDITYTSRLSIIHLMQLEEMTSLQTLTIRALPEEYRPRPFGKILLPGLVHLILDGPIPGFISGSLKTPTLKRFTIITRDTLHIPHELNIKPEELTWELIKSTWHVPLDPEDFYILLSLCRSAKTIKVPAGAGVFVVDAVKNIPDSLGLTIEISNPRTVDGNSLLFDISIEDDPSFFDTSQS